MHVLLNEKDEIVAVSDHVFELSEHRCIELPSFKGDSHALIGRKFVKGALVMSVSPKPLPELRVAVICNWNDKCGISTYSKYLVTAMRPKVKDIRVFSEISAEQTEPDEPFVIRCWSRGKRLREMVEAVNAWKPDFVVIQHEYGIFPNATHFFQMMQMLRDVPYAVMMHSVYEHLDKSVYASVANNLIVHSEKGKAILRSKGNTSNIWVIPHGCIGMQEQPELWNILQTPYSIMQFGFGFRYKGVERVLEAVSILKTRYPDKYKDIFYCFFLSNNGHNNRVHQEYFDALLVKSKEIGVEDNVAIIQKFNADKMLSLYFRMFKLAVFPYVLDAQNTVYGATGAARIAMANGIPVIASESHLFDDLEGVVPRPSSPEALAKEIGRVFSDGHHRREIVQRAKTFIEANSWDVTADKYLSVYCDIMR